MNRKAALALKIAGSLACLAALCWWIDPSDLVAQLRHAAPLPFAAAVILNLVIQMLNAVKLRALFPPPRPPLRGLIEVNFIAVFFASFIPGGVGGEVARWAYLGKESGSPERALAAVLLDRLTGLWAQILLALAAWVWIGRSGLGLWVALAAAAAVLVVSIGLGSWGYRWFTGLVARAAAWYARRKGGGAAAPQDIGAALSDLMARRSRFAKVAALSVCNHLLVITTFVLLDRTAGGGISWAQATLYIFCYTFVILLPISVGNWGLSEGALGLMYRYSGSQTATGVLISLLMRAMALPAVALGWWFFLARRDRRPPA